MAGAETLISKSAGVVIVGGGVIGCSIAYQLAKQGIMATVLERGRGGLFAPFERSPPLLQLDFGKRCSHNPGIPNVHLAYVAGRHTLGRTGIRSLISPNAFDFKRVDSARHGGTLIAGPRPQTVAGASALYTGLSQSVTAEQAD